MNRTPRKFPIEALPPKIRAAVEAAKALTQAPEALIVSSALAAVSLAVQAKYDVRRNSHLVSPCSLYFLTIAESGERKTTVDRLFMVPFEQFEDTVSWGSHQAADRKATDGNEEENEHD
jgi:hypothetical protein